MHVIAAGIIDKNNERMNNKNIWYKKNNILTFHWFITYNLKFRRKGLIAQYQDICEFLLGRGSKQHTFPSVRVSYGYICSSAPAGWRWRCVAGILEDIHFSIRCCCCCVRTHLIEFWWLLWWTQSETYSHVSHCCLQVPEKQQNTKFPLWDAASSSGKCHKNYLWVPVLTPKVASHVQRTNNIKIDIKCRNTIKTQFRKQTNKRCVTGGRIFWKGMLWGET